MTPLLLVSIRDICLLRGREDESLFHLVIPLLFPVFPYSHIADFAMFDSILPFFVAKSIVCYTLAYTKPSSSFRPVAVLLVIIC